MNNSDFHTNGFGPLILFFTTVLMGFGILLFAKRFYKIRNLWSLPLFIVIISVLSYVRFGICFDYFWIVALSSVTLFYSVKDIIDRKISDTMHLLVFLLGALRLSAETWISMIAGVFVCGLPMLIAALSKNGGVGGADIKCMASLGWALGWEKGIAAMIIGLMMSVFVAIIIGLVRRKKIKSMPMLPFLCSAAFMVFLLL